MTRNDDNDAPLLLDVSRLVWRCWTGTRPTGIDRICLAWMHYYGPRAQAVIIHRYGNVILPMKTSQALFQLLGQPDRSRSDRARFRTALAALLITRIAHLRDRLDGHGRFLLNPGHTGLDRPGIFPWTRARHLRPICLVHDLIPITHPQFCRAGEEVRHRRRMSSVLDIACGVVTNSADTLKTLSDFAGAEGRLLPSATVAWPGVPAMPAVSQLASAEAIFVVLGTIEARKNHAMLLELWRRMIDSADGKPLPQLVIVGRRGWQAEGVFARLDSGEFGDRVIEVGPADDLRLAELLATARALLFPSHAEGFGMPLVEALAAGVPVLASDLPAFREIGQDVPEFLPTDDLAAWGEAVADYANEASVRRTAQLERLERFHAPDWERHFAKINSLLSLLS